MKRTNKLIGLFIILAIVSIILITVSTYTSVGYGLLTLSLISLPILGIGSYLVDPSKKYKVMNELHRLSTSTFSTFA